MYFKRAREIVQQSIAWLLFQRIGVQSRHDTVAPSSAAPVPGDLFQPPQHQAHVVVHGEQAKTHTETKNKPTLGQLFSVICVILLLKIKANVRTNEMPSNC